MSLTFVILLLLSLGLNPAAAWAYPTPAAQECLGCHQGLEADLKQAVTHPALSGGCGTCHRDHGETPTGDSGGYLTTGEPQLCSGCHNLTGGEMLKAHRGQPFETSRCTGCHDPHASATPHLLRGVQHGPFAKRHCDTCHQPPVNGRVKLRAEVNALCLECHATAAAFDGASAKTLFGGGVTIAAGTYGMAPAIEVTENRGHPTSNHPVLRDADKDGPAITCLTCHAAHAANRNKDLLVSQTETFEPLCLRCHK